MVVTLVPLGALATVFTIAAVSIWSDGGPAPRQLGEAVTVTVVAAFSALFFCITAVGGVVRVREQLREERRQRAAEHPRSGPTGAEPEPAGRTSAGRPPRRARRR